MGVVDRIRSISLQPVAHDGEQGLVAAPSEDFNILRLGDEIERDLPKLRSAPRADSVEQYAPSPNYVEHVEGASRAAQLSAEAVAREFETAAQTVEALGREMLETAKRAIEMASNASTAAQEIAATAQHFRDRGKYTAEQIEQASVMIDNAMKLSRDMREKIGEIARD